MFLMLPSSFRLLGRENVGRPLLSISLLQTAIARLKLPPDLAAANQLRQQAVVAPLMAHAAGDDRGVGSTMGQGRAETRVSALV